MRNDFNANLTLDSIRKHDVHSFNELYVKTIAINTILVPVSEHTYFSMACVYILRQWFGSYQTNPLDSAVWTSRVFHNNIFDENSKSIG